MLHRLDQADKLAFVGRELRVLRRDGPAVERDGAVILMQDRAEARAGGVAIDNEPLLKIW